MAGVVGNHVVDTPGAAAAPDWHSGLSTRITIGLLAGVACGLFFGEYCAPLKIVGDAFVGLLQMTVLPYIIVSLIANFGRLSLGQCRRLILVGGLVLLCLWTIGLFTVAVVPLSFPAWKADSFFSTAITEPPAGIDLLQRFIPTNVFAALADSMIPAVVVFCICLGIALVGVSQRQALITPLDVLAQALTRINHTITRLTPFGVFAIMAHTAGTMSFAELSRLQMYLIAYAAIVLLMTFVVLPLWITSCTPFRYTEVIGISKDALLTAFATGKLLVVLPLLIEETEQLFERHRQREAAVTPAVDVLYPLAYPFPHLGKLLSMLFIPYAAWFLGKAMTWDQYPSFLVSGLVSYFGGPLLATPFLLDLMHLPHDMLQLFVATGVFTGRLGDALGVMHLVTFTLITTCAFSGWLRFSGWAFARYLLVSTVLGLSLIGGLRAGLQRLIPYMERKEDIIDQMQLLERPVEAEVLREASPNPGRLQPGESLLARVRRRGVLRVGFNADKLPFAYFNQGGELVGFDINMAHGLARDLGVRLEFVPFDSDSSLAQQLNADHFDVVMSGLVGTLEQSEAMLHTAPYLDLTLSLVVRDDRVRDFTSLEAMRKSSNLRIGFVSLSRGFVERLRDESEGPEFVGLKSNREFFASADRLELDALLIGAEIGSAYTLLYPDYEVVVPAGQRVTLPLVYAIGQRDVEMRDFLEHWLTLRKKDGTLQQHYDHWILGKIRHPSVPRWSVIRNVLDWVD